MTKYQRPTKRTQEREQIQNFWTTCPECNHKFSVPAAWVFKYLERIGYQAEQNS
jgi:hypothetical protein